MPTDTIYATQDSYFLSTAGGSSGPFQPPSGADTSSSLLVGSDGYKANHTYHAVFLFPTNTIASSSTVTSATINLYWSGGESTNHEMHLITGAWNENISGEPFPIGGLITTVAVSGSAYQSFSVTSTAANWVSGATANRGVRLKRQTEANNGAINPFYYAREQSDTSFDPYLSITYTTSTNASPTAATATGTGSAVQPIANMTRAATSGVNTWVGSFEKASSTGNQDITIPVDLTGAAAGTWAIMFWWSIGADTLAQVSGKWADRQVSGVGFTTGASNSYAVGIYSVNAASTADSARRMAAKCITSPDNAGTPGTWFEADFVSFPTSSSMRINWTTNWGQGGPVQYMIITGLTNAKAISWATPGATGSSSITGVGFRPDLLLHSSISSSTAPPVSATKAVLEFGVMNKHGQQWASAISIDDGVSPSDTARHQQTDSCIVETGSTPALGREASFVSMDADGFTTYFSTDSTPDYYISLCLQGISSKIGAFTTAASGTQIINTRHGFAVEGAIMSTISQAPQQNAIANTVLSIGATDTVNHRATAFADQDAQSTTSSRAFFQSATDAAIAASGGTTTQTVAYASQTSTQISIDVTTAAGGYEVLYVLLGDRNTTTYPSRVIS